MGIQSSWVYLPKHQLTEKRLSLSSPAQDNSAGRGGIVSELIYSDNQAVINHILLPLLRQSGNEARWLLWVSPHQKLSRQWLIRSGLPLDKIVQLNRINSITTVDAMERALASGNYSVVLGWLPTLLARDTVRLQSAAQKGNALAFIMRPQDVNKGANGTESQSNLLKIHSIYYH
ncbi:phosphatidate cytidylyltransferase [Photorhabdus temperata]|uniref:Cell division inhibitor SulA n=3 Tax=Photorhabdus TaxID=29487 RepID=A0A7X5QMG1_9GAMM|nr:MULTISPECIES: SOS-induced cell division inhibitor SulA [Photorhabdus]ETS30071.1 SOS cell division inhibitor SulA [Photorhabdus khanii NC19]MQL48621.1 cell division inhibitor SulA [Photorhabdus khanii]NHB97005.1 cell division inhibitor SulA [Photorhabdus stackebrandtii]OHV53848.1 phosphatidate cytidylyltransferase [Photorhabdus temperata]